MWDYAKENAFGIVSKDSDFHQLSFLFGHPPKIVWIRRGNGSTALVELLLRERQIEIMEFEQSEDASFLALL